MRSGSFLAVLICCWLLKLLQTLPPFSHSVILKSLVCRIKSSVSKRDVVLLSLDGDLYKSQCIILSDHPWQRRSNIIVAVSFYIEMTSTHFLYQLYANCVFFFGKEIIVVCGSPKQGTKTSKSAIIIKSTCKSFTLIIHKLAQALVPLSEIAASSNLFSFGKGHKSLSRCSILVLYLLLWIGFGWKVSFISGCLYICQEGLICKGQY